MIQRISAADYFDGPYGSGTHVVLLALPDQLGATAMAAFRRVADVTPATRFWVVPVGSPDEAETLEAIRFPQYRFIRNGSECHCHIGLLMDDELVDCFDRLED